MAASSNASSEDRAAQHADSLLWWMVGGFIVCAATLWLTLGEPYPTRHLATELKTFAVVYPLGLLVALVHVRRALPAQTQPLMRWFVIAVVVRVIFLAFATNYAMHHNPSIDRSHAAPSTLGLPDASRSPYDGYLVSDSYTFSLRARFVSYMLGGQPYGLDFGILWPNALAGPNQLQNADQQQSQLAMADRYQHYVVAGLIISRWGFSVLASCLPFTILGAFWCLLVYTYLHQQVSPATARWVLLWMMFAPEFLCLSAQWHEDVPSALCVMWIVHLCTPPLRQRRLGWLLGVLGTLGALRLFRAQLTPLLLAILVFDAAFRLLRQPRARAYGLVVSLGLLFLGMWYQSIVQPSQAIGSRAFPVGFAINTLIIPGPIYFFGSGILDKVYALCDLFQALVWPILGGWLLVGIGSIVAGKMTFPATGLIAQMAILCAATLRYPGEYGAMRLKLMVWPLMLAICLEAIRMARQAPEANRSRLARLTSAYTITMIMIHFAAACKGVVGGG